MYILAGYLLRSAAVANCNLFSQKPVFQHVCAMCSELPSNTRTMTKLIIYSVNGLLPRSAHGFIALYPGTLIKW